MSDDIHAHHTAAGAPVVEEAIITQRMGGGGNSFGGGLFAGFNPNTTIPQATQIAAFVALGITVATGLAGGIAEFSFTRGLLWAWKGFSCSVDTGAGMVAGAIAGNALNTVGKVISTASVPLRFALNVVTLGRFQRASTTFKEKAKAAFHAEEIGSVSLPIALAGTLGCLFAYESAAHGALFLQSLGDLLPAKISKDLELPQKHSENNLPANQQIVAIPVLPGGHLMASKLQPIRLDRA